ncbi:MAG: hypothetical protein M1822_004023 [Bathelium mastoideum]|nr:MAG: hypothetical protein M1822_004023 [Bathelium mastoideum]
MPTPNDGQPSLLSPSTDALILRAQHPTCPPEEDRDTDHSSESADGQTQPESTVDGAHSPPAQQMTPANDAADSVSAEINDAAKSLAKRMDIDEDGPLRDTPSPLSSATESKDSDHQAATASQTLTSPSTSIPYATLESPWVGQHRVYIPFMIIVAALPADIPQFLPNSTSSYLRPGSKFRGSQQSDRQVYDVQVEVKHVDMAESFLCGYLRIQGLTDDHPTLTTYFEGEIIGTKYTFQTKHPEWGSSDKVDMQHWGRFDEWRPLAKQAKRPDFSYKNYAQREHLFMRWKEYFLVPDHRVRTISGASFEGFYYICFNQITGKIRGIYFHAKSER